MIQIKKRDTMYKYLIETTTAVLTILSVAFAWRWAGPAFAQSGGGYELTRSTTASSYYSSGGGYSLGATAGQAEAGSLRGDKYVLIGGFWGVTYDPPGPQIYLPIVRR